MSDSKENLVTVKVRRSDSDWILDEQSRIRHREGNKIPQAEIFQRMRRIYEDHLDPVLDPQGVAPALLAAYYGDDNDLKIQLQAVVNSYKGRVKSSDGEEETPEAGKRRRA